MHSKEEKLMAFSRLLDVMAELREKCPWDRKQTFTSLRNNTIEEVYELADAISKGDLANIKKELGDVLLHVVFYAQMGSESNDFDIKDVCDTLTDKLIFRHPHVYGDVQADTATEVKENWEQLKLHEKNGNRSTLAGVPDALPALIKATRIQEKACNAGFDWEERHQVWEKVQEEIAEFQHEIDCNDAEGMEAEFGDFFFSMVNAARLYNIDPENALERTNRKFIRRFNALEAKTTQKGIPLKTLSLAEMEILWNEAKAEERAE
ncbi:MAG: nucleoside triphosphate pyrophosphohydrolase [Prevotellaceae bacterium]|jgi:XTP/dITP diphosphohydrolase|nr:nucleoside triphosphate pyrophosphohydrolase [Prevotellaceae bacterium]